MRRADTELAKATRPVSHDGAAAARQRLETFANALLDASISVLDKDEYTAIDGDVGLDATPNTPARWDALFRQVSPL